MATKQRHQRLNLATPHEVSEFLEIPLQTLHLWSSRGIGPRVIKVGRHNRYRWEDIDSWLETQAK